MCDIVFLLSVLCACKNEWRSSIFLFKFFLFLILIIFFFLFEPQMKGRTAKSDFLRHKKNEESIHIENMPLMKKFSLDTRDEKLFYHNFFTSFFTEHHHFLNVLHFYQLLTEHQKAVEKWIHFFPSVEFRFLDNYFMNKYINCNHFIDFLKSTDFQPSVARALNGYFSIHDPFEKIYTDQILSLDEKRTTFRDLFADLSDSFRGFSYTKFFTMEDYECIRQSMTISKRGFLQVLLSYGACKRDRPIILLDSKNKRTAIPNRMIKKNRNKRLHIRFYHDPILYSRVRPWLIFDSMYIRCIDKTNLFYEDPLSFILFEDKQWHRPSLHFHTVYSRNIGKQKGTLYSMDGNQFMILYQRKDSFFLQDEKIFMLQNDWRTDILISSLPHIVNLPTIFKINDLLKTILDQRFAPLLHPHFNASTIIKIIMDSLLSRKGLSVQEKCFKIFSIIGRCTGPMSRYQPSFLSKINHNYLYFEHVLDAPHDLLWPELYLYPISDQKKLLKNWDLYLDNFYHSVMGQFIRDEYAPLRLVYKDPPCDMIDPIDHDCLYDFILHHGKLINLKECDQEGDGDVGIFFDFDFIENGLDMIHILVDPPAYWIGASADATETPIEKKETKMDIKDIYTFLDECENRTLTYIAHPNTEIILEDESHQNEECLDELPDDCLEDEMFDLEEFHTVIP